MYNEGLAPQATEYAYWIDIDMDARYLRNVAIIAHVDHGKTTLVDGMLYQSGMFRNDELDRLAGGRLGLIMDSNPLERERGITILAKNCSVYYTAKADHDSGSPAERYKINIIDTPGHADFGGEVERVLGMADAALLVVDAFEGPMPQTRFVLHKALEAGLRLIVVVNKVDRADARPHQVVSEVFDLFVELGADDHALDFPVLYASAKDGWASDDPDNPTDNIEAVFEAIIKHVPPPSVELDAPLGIHVTALEYSDYVGKIAVGKIASGSIAPNQPVAVIDREGAQTDQKVLQVFQFEGLGKREVEKASAGDICAVVGLDPVNIGDTIACVENPRALESVAVDEPTLHMTFRVNDGPFAGKEGRFVTSRQISERLQKELKTNVALHVAPGETPEEFIVSGRGLMHLGILLENMRREGYELCVGRPSVIFHEVDGHRHEPIEHLVVTCPLKNQSAVMSLIGTRRAEMVKHEPIAGAGGYVNMEFEVPARGLIGLAARMLTATQGNAIMHHTFLKYDRMRGPIPDRQSGVMIASHTGSVTAYALNALTNRGVFFVEPGEAVYAGQAVGEHCMEGDIAVNVVKAKQLNNVRSSTKELTIKIRAKREVGLEAALEYIQNDELVEVTPRSLRMRKRILDATERKRFARRRVACETSR